MVFIAVSWGHDGEKAWESQSRFLPNDVSAGQSITASLLVRPPPEPGEYQLFLQLLDNEVGAIGIPSVQEVVVSDPLDFLLDDL
ncbi:MAG: hypothetical protein SWK76_12710 [Actinomycetota bacterium]|nr:hypothetical protein [Actinomycetota bacterium]